MTGHYENLFRLDGSFELWVKATSAWAKTTTKNDDKVQLCFQKLKEKLAYRYFFSMSRDEESHSARKRMWKITQSGVFIVFFLRIALKGHIINNLLNSSFRTSLGQYIKAEVWDFPVMTSLSVNKWFIKRFQELTDSPADVWFSKLLPAFILHNFFYHNSIFNLSISIGS